MNKPTASVEIFHDVYCGEQDTEGVLQGLAIVEAIAGQLDVVRDTRKLKLTFSSYDPVQMDKIRWPQLGADFNLVLTSRTIVNNNYPIEGVSLRNGLQRVAIVDSEYEHLPIVVAHELGHLFRLKETGQVAIDGHCALPECVMAAGAEAPRKTMPKSSSRTERILGKLGLKAAEFVEVNDYDSKHFCDECSDQLEKTAAWWGLKNCGQPYIEAYL